MLLDFGSSVFKMQAWLQTWESLYIKLQICRKVDRGRQNTKDKYLRMETFSA